MKYWHSALLKNLQRRAFDACYCATKEEALAKALSLIDKEQCVSWGGSMTFGKENGTFLENLLRTQGYNVIDRDTAKKPGRTPGASAQGAYLRYLIL